MNGLCLAFDFPGKLADAEYTIEYNDTRLSVFNGNPHYSHYIKANIDRLGFDKTFFAATSFLGEFCWFYRLKVSFSACVHGSGSPTCSDRSHLDHTNTVSLCNFTQEVLKDDAHLALAFYREGFSSNSPFYRLLSYYKVLEIPFDGLRRKSWIDQNASRLQAQKHIPPYLKKNVQGDPFEWIYKHARHGIAHGNKHLQKTAANI